MVTKRKIFHPFLLFLKFPKDLLIACKILSSMGNRFGVGYGYQTACDGRVNARLVTSGLPGDNKENSSFANKHFER